MLRDNLAGLIEPMMDRAELISSVVISKRDKTGDAPGPPELAIRRLKRSWRQISRKNGATGRKGKMARFWRDHCGS